MTHPLVSVLIPVRNEEHFLHQCLGAVLQQDYPHLEILVIDGESDDRTVAIILEFQTQDPRVKLLHNPGRRQCKALNIGLEAAQGEIIVRIDGHTLIEADYVRQAVELLTQNIADNVGGKQEAVGTSLTGQAIAITYQSRFAVPSAYRNATEDQLADTVYLGAWRRDIFDRVGGWDETYLVHEDYEHNYRIRKSGGKVLLTLRMKSKYYCRDSFTALRLQFYRYGQDKIKMLRRHPDSLRYRHLVAPLFVFWLIFGGVLSLFSPKIRAVWLATVGFYGTVDGLVSFYHAQGNWALFWRLCLAFPIIHLAWGIGFWRGLLKRKP